MSIAYNPRTVMSGLVCYLDAANAKSYSGSGSAWNSIIGGPGATINVPYTTGYFNGDGGSSGQSTGVVDLSACGAVTAVLSVKSQSGSGTIIDMTGTSQEYQPVVNTTYAPVVDTPTKPSTVAMTLALTPNTSPAYAYTTKTLTDALSAAISLALTGNVSPTFAHTVSTITDLLSASFGSSYAGGSVGTYAQHVDILTAALIDGCIFFDDFGFTISITPQFITVSLRRNTKEVLLSVPYVNTYNDKFAVILTSAGGATENISIYQNGSKIGGSAPSIIPSLGGYKLNFLSRNGQSDYGTISLRSLALYGRALSASEILQIYAAIGTV